MTPAKSLRISDAWLAYDLNEAVAWFGAYVEAKANEKTKGGKPKYTLQQILNGESEPRGILQMMALSGKIEFDV